jgi:DUF4097 and DUF4098 domain-containing protein YvlB
MIMPEFDTSGPIDATVDVSVGDVRITAGDRPGTLVEVRPSNPGSDRDVRAAEETRIECADGHLLVRGPKLTGLNTLFGKPGSIDVQISLATGSRLRSDAGVGSVRTSGTLGDCRIKCGVGAIWIERAAAVEVSSGAGDVEIDEADGFTEVSTGSGSLRIDVLHGAAVTKNSNGTTRIGSVAGDLRASASNGDVLIGDAAAGVTAATANGSIRIDSVGNGTVSLKTAFGELEVGVPAGTAAYLDLHTKFGNVRNTLDATPGPIPGEPAVEIHARTSYGDIVVRRPVRSTP